jgi:site-specific DNA-methyltransferase (adenine-specific)
MITNEKPKIELIHGDCMEYMATLEDNAFELAIVDPPYGINAEHGTNRASRKKFAEKPIGWDSAIPSDNYFIELQRVTKNQIIWGGNYFFDYLGNTRSFIIWDKLNPDRNFADCELAWCSLDRVARIFNNKRVQEMNRDDGGKIHPTQKPVKLYEWLLKNYAKEGDKILDTHLGSGSSAIAAYNYKFDFVGIEIDKDYYNDALQRFNKHKSQLQLF